MKILIVRISSFGDILQCLNVPRAIKQKYPEAEIHWLVREDFSSLIALQPLVHKIHTVKRNSRFTELLTCFKSIKNENYDSIYDAHNNLRSFLLRLFLLFSGIHWLSRSKNRIRRLLFFNFRLKTLPTPFVGQTSFLSPLEKWGITSTLGSNSLKIDTHTLQKITPLVSDAKGKRKLIVAAASANWEMKRWPIEHWQKVLEMSKNENWHWIFLGGKEDQFIQEFLKPLRSDNFTNLSGQLSLMESIAVASLADAVVANDTGLMHVADQLGVNTLALIGPTAFGYPFSSTSKVLEVSLSCKPCSKDGRGKCVQETYKLCLLKVEPERIYKELKNIL